MATSDGVYNFTASSPNPVLLLIELRVDNQWVVDSPVFVRVNPLPCQAKHQVYTSRGCACAKGHTYMLNQCIRSDELAFGIICALLLFIAIAIVMSKQYYRIVSDRRWILSSSRLKLASPPVQVGSGSFGPVFAADFNNTDVVLKAYSRPKGLGPRIKSKSRIAAISSVQDGPMTGAKLNALPFQRRMRLLSKLYHPNVIRCFGVILDTKQLVLEFMPNLSLYNVLHQSDMAYGATTLMSFVRDTIEGLAFLHAHQPCILHGRLTSKNVLVDGNFRCKLSDCIAMYEPTPLLDSASPWLSPEAKGGLLVPASDVYSFAIVAQETFDRQAPKLHENKQLSTMSGLLAVPIPPAVQGVLTQCQSRNPLERPSCQRIQKVLRRQRVQTVGQVFVQRGLEGRRQDRVLQQVFPKHIAEQLKAGIKPEIEHKPDVCVLFTDILGFDKLLRDLTPEQMSDLMDRYLSKLDSLVQELDLYKVDVIRDCVIVAGNLLKNQSDHVSRVCRFALGATKAAENTFVLEGLDIGRLSTRCGIHVGEVCANVVGRISPKYTLLGDTMNTASRMESTAPAGYIQLTERAAQALTSQDPVLASRLNERGVVSIKGKGDLLTYWLLRPGQDMPSNDTSARPSRATTPVLDTPSQAFPPALVASHAERASWSEPSNPLNPSNANHSCSELSLSSPRTSSPRSRRRSYSLNSRKRTENSLLGDLNV
eukprot:TRINITY_DN12566_c0_g7_i2.p1 TRINITY_DN12566_c0_g7~~TRINITY_DN12566_c0_g7_i2.p1  ORF type:complete len:785 (+),score=108.13 TRINITY_DN12566_c0_g7_i2:234-2357(+)